MLFRSDAEYRYGSTVWQKKLATHEVNLMDIRLDIDLSKQKNLSGIDVCQNNSVSAGIPQKDSSHGKQQYSFKGQRSSCELLCGASSRSH